MQKVFISSLTIGHVRHLKNIAIPLSADKMKHLIFTGKNGSGKTSVLDELAHCLSEEVFVKSSSSMERLKAYVSKMFELQGKEEVTSDDLSEEILAVNCKNDISAVKNKIDLTFNQSLVEVSTGMMMGEFILAYYKADRLFQVEVPKHIEKVELKDRYSMLESPGREFVRYLLDLKATESFARNSGKYGKADEIGRWFAKFQELLQKVFDEDSLELIFDEDTFSFYIKESGKDIFDFNTLSSGFAAVLDIVLDMMIRMEKKANRSFDFNVPGIVLVDEIETHLHIELQKTVLGLLTTIFPNVQFIVSTHSPFILSSIPDAVIYDLEKNILVENGLENIPYGGIVEGYFHSSEMSKSLEEKFERYKMLVRKQKLTDDDFEEIAELELFLNEIPDYLALDITTEYQRLKLELEGREDI